MSSGAPAPYDEENNVEASLLQRGSLSLENGGAEPKGRARPPVTQPHWVAFIRSYPTPLFNSLTAVFALLAFVFFVATVSLSQRTQLVLHAAKQPLGCPVAPCGAAPAPAGGRQAITVPTAAVAADEPRCSAVGNATLSAGGTAVDAAVSTALCLGVLHPHSSGVGGGCFILIYTAATGDAEVIDARETAPAAATENMYSGNPSASVIGGLAVAVPGELRGLYLAWQRHGALPWSDLVLPAAALADGFIVEPQLAAAISSNAAAIAANANLARVLMPRGSPLQPGDTCSNPSLARTLRDVASRGPDASFYGAPHAAAMAADVRAAGGVLTSADVRGYAPVVRNPLVATSLGVTLLTAPPPSSGGAVVSFLAEFVGGYPTPLAAAGLLGVHRTVEGFKHGFAARMGLGDPMDPFVRNNTAEIDDLLSPDWAAAMRALTSDAATQPVTVYGPPWNPLAYPDGQGPPPEDHGTTHLSVVDGRRNAVALTSTINTAFGSKVMTSSGVIMNNEMDDFSTPGQPNGYGLHPSVANYIRPGKRPLSSMSPTIALITSSGALRAVVGASGGPRIITATASALLALLARGDSPNDSVQAPRLHHQLLPDVAFYERTVDGYGSPLVVPEAVLASLRARGHACNATTNNAVVQLISVDPDSGNLTAVSDLRKGGEPAGF